MLSVRWRGGAAGATVLASIFLCFGEWVPGGGGDFREQLQGEGLVLLEDFSTKTPRAQLLNPKSPKPKPRKAKQYRRVSSEGRPMLCIHTGSSV